MRKYISKGGKQKEKFTLVAKVIVGIGFLSVFVMNLSLFVNQSDFAEGLSLFALKAFADGSSEEIVSGVEKVVGVQRNLVMSA